jgi:hypothetical protein
MRAFPSRVSRQYEVEMLTGRQLFACRTTSDSLAAAPKSDVDLTAIPAQVRPVLERRLRREPRER